MLRLATQVTTSPTASAPQLVGHLGHGPHLGAPGGEEGDDLVLADLLAEPRRRGPRPPGCRRRATAVPTAGPSGRTGRAASGGAAVPPEHHAVLAPEALGVGAVEDGEAHGRVEPALGIVGELGVDGEAGGQGQPGRLGGGAEDVERGPGPLGVDVVDGDRGDAAPVVDARGEQRAEVVGQIGRGLDVDLGREDQAGDGDGPGQLLGRARRGVVHGRPRLGQEVLDDHLLDVAVARWASAMAARVRAGPARVSPMPTRMPVVKGMASSPGGVQGGQPALGGLVGRAAVAGQVGVERLEHHPLAGRDRPQAGQLVGPRAPALAWGSRPVSSRTSAHMATR